MTNIKFYHPITDLQQPNGYYYTCIIKHGLELSRLNAWNPRHEMDAVFFKTVVTYTIVDHGSVLVQPDHILISSGFSTIKSLFEITRLFSGHQNTYISGNKCLARSFVIYNVKVRWTFCDRRFIVSSGIATIVDNLPVTNDRIFRCKSGRGACTTLLVTETAWRLNL